MKPRIYFLLKAVFIFVSATSVANSAPVARDDAFTVNADSVGNSFDVMTNDVNLDGGALSITSVGIPDNGGTAIVDDNGTAGDTSDDSIAYAPAAGFSGTESFTYQISDGVNTSQGTISVTVASANDPVIDVWYGPNQNFGHIGQPQTWVNILGNVSDSDGVDSLSYSLNGGPSVSMGIGPFPSSRPRRLLEPGDFNADIATSLLSSGSHTVAFTATDTLGNQSTETVTFDYQDAPVWPLPYSIDWSAVQNISDVSMIIDGLWALEGDGVRTVEVGYDRIIGIGDVSWVDYEVTVPVTVHGIDPVCVANIDDCRGPPAVNVLVRWQGHYDWNGNQPFIGYAPIGATAQYEWYRTDLANGQQSLRGGEFQLLTKDASRDMPFGATYMFKVRAETTPGVEHVYSFKMWPEGDPEPAAWELVGTEAITSTSLANGSVLLVAHNVDVTYGDVTINPLTPDGTAPVISNINVLSGQSDATVTWDTDEPSDSSIVWGQSIPYTDGSVFDAGLLLSHSLALSGLLPDTQYHYKLGSADASGNLAETGDLTFTTAPDAPPIVSNIQVMTSDTTATVTWDTNEPTDSSVVYGLTTAYSSGPVANAQLVTSHSITLTGLQPNTLYHYQASSTDTAANTSTSGDMSFTTGSAFGAASDDFNNTLDTGVWTIIDPRGDSIVTTTGSQASISLPAGSKHDAWKNNTAARLMQAANDTDFELEAKFDSVMDSNTQGQGILVEQDSDTFLRFDMFFDGNATRLFSAFIDNGSANSKIDVNITASVPLYLRVNRTGDQWSYWYSADGANWTQAGSYTQAITVNAVGLFAGNSGTLPAFTAVIDYFRVNGGGNTAPVAVNDAVAVDENSNGIVLAVKANDTDPEGDTLSIVAVGTPDQGGSAILNDNGTPGDSSDDYISYTPMASFSGTETFTYDLSDGALINQAMVTVSVNNVINDAPVAANDAFSVAMNSSNNILDVKANDTDPEGDTLSIVSVGTPDQGGSVILNDNGTPGDSSDDDISYTPALSFSGTETFTYDLSDGALTSQGTVTVTVNNDPPAIISNLQASVTNTTATITWETNEPTDSSVVYGLTTAYGSDPVADAQLVTTHNITLTGLQPNTLYHYQASSTDTSANVTVSGDLTFTTATATGIASDEFTDVLNAGRWTFVDPLGDSIVTTTGTQVAISVPAGVQHNAWRKTNTAARLMQAANDTDFELEAKFDSVMDSDTQGQGILVEQDEDTFLRFDVFFDGNATRVFSAFIDGRKTNNKIDVNITASVPLYLRVNRTGDQWSYWYSADGVNWTLAGSYTQAITVNAVGLFAGNSGTLPAFTAIIDYFRVNK